MWTNEEKGGQGPTEEQEADLRGACVLVFLTLKNIDYKGLKPPTFIVVVVSENFANIRACITARN